MTELDRLSDMVQTSGSIKERAAIIYRKALNKNLLHGRSITTIAAGALYAACRSAALPRTLREIAEVSLVDKKDVARNYRLLLRELDIQMPIPDPLTYVSKIAETIDISGQSQGLAVKILHEAMKKRITAGKDPMGLAATAQYIACIKNGEKKTQKEVAKVADISEVTIRNLSKTLTKQLDLTLPERTRNI
jgi:transcription initiation factor TFIIB